MHGQKLTAKQAPERRRSPARGTEPRENSSGPSGAPHSANALRPGAGRAPEPGIPPFLTAHADGATLAIRLQPRASRTEIGELSGPELRIKVTAPPVDSAANEALVELLAEILDCPRGHVQLIRGQTSRSKVVKIYGLAAAAVLRRLAR